MKLKFTLFSLILLSTFTAFSQPWMENIKKEKSGKGQVSFFDIQEAFHDFTQKHNIEKGYYFENGEKKKFGGWKQYKRWEHFWEVRVDPETGAFPEATPFLENKKHKKKTTTHKNEVPANWVNLGTDSSYGGYAGIGRLNTIGFHPSDPNTYWVGAPSGGLWKTNDDGENWVTLTDKNAVIGVSDIAIPSDYETSHTLYIATGDRDARDNYSVGVLKSTDGGQSWEQTLPLEVANLSTVNRLMIHPTSDDTLYAAVDNIYGESSKGLFRSIDAGENWTKISDLGFIDLEFNPLNPSVMYASTYSNPTKIYKSIDAGDSWSSVNSVTGRRTEIAVTPDDTSMVYAVVANTNSGLEGIYVSTNSGDSFQKFYSEKNLLGWESSGDDAGGQGWYDLTIAADPNHADTLFVGGINTWRSIDSGKTWQLSNHWWGDVAPAVHADKHEMAYQNGTSVLFEGNDGGIYRTTDAGESWEDLTNGMVISQIYKIGMAQSDTDIVINGLQDNGTKLYYKGNWYDQLGGDGMDCMIDYEDAAIQYGTQYYGAIYRTMDMWSNAQEITASNAGSGAWVTPLAMDPSNPEIIYGGYADLWRSENRGDNWKKISNVNSSQKLRSIAISRSKPDAIYIADLQHVWRTANSGGSWTDITNNLPVSSAAITNIAVHADSSDVVWVTMGGYNSESVYKSTNGGNDWVNISEGLPQLPVLDVTQNITNTENTEIYAGTDVGVYRKIGSNPWTPYDSNLPNVIVNDLDIYYNYGTQTSILRAATYGRGLWETEIPTKDYVANPTNIGGNPSGDQIELSWNPNAGNDSVLIAWAEDNSFGVPNPSIDYVIGDNIDGGGQVIYFENSKNSFLHESLNSFTDYHYKFWSFNGNDFSSGIHYQTQTTCDTPSVQVSNIRFNDITDHSMKLSWSRGDGDNVLITARTNYTAYADPVMSVGYNANSSYGEGEAMDNENYVVFNGNANSTKVTGLDPQTQYYFKIYEYNLPDSCYLTPGQEAGISTTSVNIEDIALSTDLLVQPNPASGLVKISALGETNILKLEVVDLAGKMIYQDQNISLSEEMIDVSDWSDGAYIIKVYLEGEIRRQKLIVQ